VSYNVSLYPSPLKLIASSEGKSLREAGSLAFFGSLVCAPSTAYWIGVFLIRIYERADLLRMVYPFLIMTLPLCFGLSLFALFFGIVALSIWSLNRTKQNAIAAILFLLAAVLYIASPIHFFWVAGAGL
jgi:hypothetical protein